MATPSGMWRWFRQNVDLLMLAALAVTVVGAWAVIELADEVLEGEAQKYDDWVLEQLRSPDDPTRAIGPEWFEASWHDVTALGSGAVLALVTLACAGYLTIARRYRTLVVLAVVIGGGVILAFSMKALFARPRPEFASSVTYVVSASFPSGHSMLSAVVYMTLSVLVARTSTGFRFKVYFISLGLIVTLLVGFSRVYLGVHYPTDVLAGWGAALTWALLCWFAVAFLQKSGLIERPNTPSAIDTDIEEVAK